MKTYKNYLLIAIFSFMSFIAGLTINEAKATINSTHNVNSNVNTQTIYIDGERYVVITSSAASMSVIRR